VTRIEIGCGVGTPKSAGVLRTIGSVSTADPSGLVRLSVADILRLMGKQNMLAGRTLTLRTGRPEEPLR